MNDSIRLPVLHSRSEQMPRKLFLVRHGRSVWNGSKRVSGQLDPPLSVEGRHQALYLQRALHGESINAIYTSTLNRALDTARPTAHRYGLEIQPCAGLKEQHLGIAQGRYRDHRDPEVQALWERRKADRLDFRIPGGETYRELQARVIACLQAIIQAHAEDNVLIVGHRNSNRVMLGALMGWFSQTAAQLRLRSHYLYEIVPTPRAQICTISLRQRDTGCRRTGFWL